jgi:adenylate cyclase
MKLIRNLPLRFNILSIFILLLVSTVSFILYYSYTRNTDTFLRQSRASITSVSRSCINKTQDYLRPAAKLASIASNLLHHDVVPLEDWVKVERLAIDLIREYPQLAMFNLGDEQGNFLMIKKMPDKTLATKIIDRRKKIPTVTWKYRNPAGKVIKTETSTNVKYDPRVRPWYKSAIKTKKLCWSNLYFFYTDKKPGISASFPVVNRQGRVVGALGFDITLAELSEFLQTVNVSSNAETLVVNDDSEVIASIDAARAVVKRQGKLQPARINELGIDWLEHSCELYKKSKQNKFNFIFKGKSYLASYTNFPRSLGKNWKLIVVVPESDFTANLENTNRITMLISLLILIGGITLVALFSNLISKPMTLLTQETVKVKDFDLSHRLKVNSHISEIHDMAEAIKAMKTGLRAFQKYVPSSLVRDLISSGHEAELGGESREITLFFSDIEGFTPFSENLSPQELMLNLSEYLTLMTAHIQENSGTVDKFIGDSIMAFWGAPQKMENHPEMACRAAIGCRRIIEMLKEQWIKDGKTPLHTRMGLHTGDAVVGNLGSADRMNYTAMGDSVNLASRLEGVNKIYGTTIIVSEETYQRTSEQFIFRELDCVAVKGKKRGIIIYELIDEIDMEIKPAERSFIKTFEQGVRLYRERKWQEALELFTNLQSSRPDDLSIKLYLERCENFIATPPPADWDGIYQIKVK